MRADLLSMQQAHAALTRSHGVYRAKRVPLRGRTVLYSVFLIAGIASCNGGPNAPHGAGTVPRVNGTFPLVRISGQQLPADLGPIPTRDGSEPTCRFTAREGSLTLDPGGQYQYGYGVYSSCDSTLLLGSQGSHGSYVQEGVSLAFRADLGEGRYRLFSGLVSDSLITISNEYFAFRRLQ